jgi:hypothetical protein
VIFIPVSSARLIFVAVMMALLLQAFVAAVGSIPLGFFDGSGGD